MSNMNRDLDRYLRNRNSDRQQYSGPGWFDKVFASAEEQEKEEITPDETEQLHEMEEEIQHGEEQLEVVQEIEEGLEEEQEKKVSIYHQVLRMFQNKGDPHEYEEVDMPHHDEAVEDFRALARIQVKWLSRLPLRARQAFRDSEDYKEMTEILERRGVARRK